MLANLRSLYFVVIFNLQNILKRYGNAILNPGIVNCILTPTMLHLIVNFCIRKRHEKKYLLLGGTFPSFMMTNMIDTTCITPL